MDRAAGRARTYPRVMSRACRRTIVSIGTAACLLFAAVTSALVGSYREAPAYALSTSVVFYLERFLATLAGSCVVLAVVVRGLISGELPTEIPREGMTWPESAAAARSLCGICLKSYTGAMANQDSERIDEEQAQQAARAELFAILAASRAERAVLREKVLDARRRLQRIAYGKERPDLR